VERSPVPLKYNNATSEFMRFLDDAADVAGLATANQAFMLTEGVVRVFRRRLVVRDAIAFADVLPAVLRAIFVADWDIDEPVKRFVHQHPLITAERHHDSRTTTTQQVYAPMLNVLGRVVT